MIKLDLLKKTYDIFLISLCFLKNTFYWLAQNIGPGICFSDLLKAVSIKQILFVDKVKLKNSLIFKKTQRDNEIIFSSLSFLEISLL